MDISVQAFKRCEIVLKSDKNYDNPFLDVEIDAVFKADDGTIIKIPGFWDGDNLWKVRFSAQKEGKWQYEVTCTDKENPSLTDSGTINVSACLEPKNNLERHGFVRLEQGKRYMVYNDGTPFFYIGDTHWMMPDYERINQCNYPDCSCGNQFKHLADDRIEKGFNVYQTYFAGHRTAPSSFGREGWWEDGSFTKINPTPFKDVDYMMDYLADNGITIALGLGLHYFTVKIFKQDVTKMKRFARYIVARYACYPLVWITAQEITNKNENAFDFWRQIGAYVGSIDGFKRPNGAHMHPHTFDTPAPTQLQKDDWHQWWALQGGHGGLHCLCKRAYYQGYYEDCQKVFIETENQYEDIYCGGFTGHDAPRIAAWQAVLSGSAGFTYGVTGVWVMGWHQKYAPGSPDYSPDSWFTGIDKPGSTQISYMKKFFEYVGWYELTPHYGYEFGNFENRSNVCISHKGQDLIIYYMYSSPAKEAGKLLNLKKNVKYQARWFDPICGKFIDLAPIISKDGSYPIPERPSKRDWVLLLNTYDLGEYPSYEYPEKYPVLPKNAYTLGEEIPIVNIKSISEDEEHPAANILDGDPDTYWMGFKFKTSQMLTMDLGQSQDVGYMYIKTPLDESRCIQYTLFGSDDGKDFTVITERIFMDLSMGKDRPEHIEPIKKKYRYIRLFLNAQDHPSVTKQFPISQIKFFKEG